MARRAGFHSCTDTEDMFRQQFEQLRLEMSRRNLMTSLLDPLVAAFRRAMDERNDCNKPPRAERQFMLTYAKGGVCSSTRD